MPDEIYSYSKALLPNGSQATAYALKEPDDYMPAEQSIIKIVKDNILVNTISVQGDIKAMRSMAKNGLLAVITEQGSEILIYNPSEAKPEKSLNLGSTIQSLLSTPEYLIAAAKGSLFIYDNSSFILHKEIPAGNVIGSMTATNQFLICDVWKKENAVSQVTMYDYLTGELIRPLGEARVKDKIRTSFMGLLNDENVFVALPKKFNCDIFVYKFKTGKLLQQFEITNRQQLYIHSLPQGGMAVHQEEAGKTVNIYHPLESQLPESSITSLSDLDLKTQEDMILFVSDHERGALPELIKGLTQHLQTMGLFNTRISQLITEYSVSSEALEQKEVDMMVENTYKQQPR